MNKVLITAIGGHVLQGVPEREITITERETTKRTRGSRWASHPKKRQNEIHSCTDMPLYRYMISIRFVQFILSFLSTRPFRYHFQLQCLLQQLPIIQKVQPRRHPHHHHPSISLLINQSHSLQPVQTNSQLWVLFNSLLIGRSNSQLIVRVPRCRFQLLLPLFSLQEP